MENAAMLTAGLVKSLSPASVVVSTLIPFFLLQGCSKK